MPYNLNNIFPKPTILNDVVVPSQSLTVGIAAGQFAAFNNATDLITFDVQTSNVRVRWDGTAPTATSGHILYAGNGYTFSKGLAQRCRFIRDTAAASDATIFASEMGV